MLKFILVAFLSLFLLGSSCNDYFSPEDNGLKIQNGEPLKPYTSPWIVLVDENSVGGDFGFPERLIKDAVDWWNSELRKHGAEKDYFIFERDYDDDSFGTIAVYAGYVGSSSTGDSYYDPTYFYDGSYDEVLGRFNYSYFDGFITDGNIIVSSDITYHNGTVLDVLKHELGHALCLDDDSGSKSLNSVMGSPLVNNGSLLKTDAMLVLGNQSFTSN